MEGVDDEDEGEGKEAAKGEVLEGLGGGGCSLPAHWRDRGMKQDAQFLAFSGFSVELQKG